MSDRIGGAMPKWQQVRFTIHQLGESPQSMTPGQVPGITPVPGLFSQPRPVSDPLELVELPVSTPADVTRGLGLDPAEDSGFRKYLEGLLGSDNEAVLRQQVVSYAMQHGFDPDLRRVLLARALKLYNAVGVAQGRAEYLRQRLRAMRPPGDPMRQVIKAERYVIPSGLVKGGGEGSRGGRVIGHTSSGKPVYAPDFQTAPHAASSPERGRVLEAAHAAASNAGYLHHEHVEAAKLHEKAAKEAKKAGRHGEAVAHSAMAGAHAVAAFNTPKLSLVPGGEGGGGGFSKPVTKTPKFKAGRKQKPAEPTGYDLAAQRAQRLSNDANEATNQHGHTVAADAHRQAAEAHREAAAMGSAPAEKVSEHNLKAGIHDRMAQSHRTKAYSGSRLEDAHLTSQFGKSGAFHILEKSKAGPFIGPNGGKWRDAQHTQHWTAEDEREHWGDNPHPAGDWEAANAFERDKSKAVRAAAMHDHVRSMVKEPKGWMPVKTKSGEMGRPAPVAHQHGDYAVHPDLGETGTVYTGDGLPGAAPRRWTVSHAPSGQAVTKKLSKEDAKEMARHLAQHAPGGDKDSIVAAVTALRTTKKEAKAKADAMEAERSLKAQEEEIARQKEEDARSHVDPVRMDGAELEAKKWQAESPPKHRNQFNAGVEFGKKIVADKAFPDKKLADARKQLGKMSDPHAKRHVIEGHVADFPEDEASSWLAGLAAKKAGVSRKDVSHATLAHDPFWRGVHAFGHNLRASVEGEPRAKRTAENRAALHAKHGTGDLGERPVAPAPAPVAAQVDWTPQDALDVASEVQAAPVGAAHLAEERAVAARTATKAQTEATTHAEDRSKVAHWEAYHHESHLLAAEAHDKAAKAWEGKPQAAEHAAKVDANYRPVPVAPPAAAPAPAPAGGGGKPRGQLDLFRSQRFHVSLERLEKAEPRGGKYHARVKSDSGNFRYYYDEQLFQRSKHAPVMGTTVLKDRLRKELLDKVGDNGVGRDALEFGDRYPDGMAADLVKELADAGQLTWAGDVLKKPDAGVTVRPETVRPSTGQPQKRVTP